MLGYNKTMKYSGRLSLAFSIVLIIGCATSVSYRTSRLPAWDTMGMQRISVLPFDVSDDTSLQRQAAAMLNNVLLSRIRETNYFVMIDPSEVARIQAANTNTAGYVDGIFNGRIVSLLARDTSRTDTRVDPKTKDEKNFTIYEREVQLSFNYSLSRTRDGIIVGVKNISDSAYDYFELEVKEEESDDRNRGNRDRGRERREINLKPPETMVQEIINKNMKDISRDFVPYTVVESRKLMKETSKDKELQERLKNATALVKAGNYRIAQDTFLGIYQDTASFAAAYNASLLMMVQGNMSEAASFMQRVYYETGNPRAISEANSIQRTISNESTVAAFRDSRNRQDTLVSSMVSTLSYRMPDNAKIAVVNNSRNERDLAEIITNGIINGLQSGTRTLVDRNNMALLEAERNYQLSGYVDDTEIVSIGKEAGVNIFILVSITGSSNLRYLSVRMLDVERNSILYQSPQNDETKL